MLEKGGRRSRLEGTRSVALAVSAVLVAVLGIGSVTMSADVDDPELCLVERSGNTATLSWFDLGGSNVVRRNGTWQSSPGQNVSTFVDTQSPVGATYELRT